MDVLYIGGSGQISLPCVERSVAAGHKVTVFNRGRSEEKLPDGVELITGDMSDADSYAQIASRKFDVVCQFMAFKPEQMKRDIEMFAGMAGQYIFISSASVYEKPARHYIITEKTPTVNPFWRYSQDKIACEALLKASSGLDWTIVRPSHTMRVGLPTMTGHGHVLGRRMIEGKPVLVAGDGWTPWTLTRAGDLAVPFVGLFGRSAAIGEDFHITGDRGFTWDDIYKTIAAGLGVEANIVHVPTDTLVRYNPDWNGELRGDKSLAALFDNSKVKKVAGDFTCSEDLAEVLAEPLRYFSRARDRGTLQSDPNETLYDRIAAEQSALGR